MFQSPDSEKTPEEIQIQSNVNHFMIAVNLLAVAICLQLVDIHLIYMGSASIVFYIVEAYIVHVKLNTIFYDYVLMGIFAFFLIFYSEVKKIRMQKTSFLKSKKT